VQRREWHVTYASCSGGKSGSPSRTGMQLPEALPPRDSADYDRGILLAGGERSPRELLTNDREHDMAKCHFSQLWLPYPIDQNCGDFLHRPARTEIAFAD
jgi:hypothetical protein